MLGWLAPLIVGIGVVAIFLTTDTGKKLLETVGLYSLIKSGPAKEDREFLLRVCGGDPREVARRLEAERQRNPTLDSPQIYRRAIRTYMNDRRDEAE